MHDKGGIVPESGSRLNHLSASIFDLCLHRYTGGLSPVTVTDHTEIIAVFVRRILRDPEFSHCLYVLR